MPLILFAGLCTVVATASGEASARFDGSAISFVYPERWFVTTRPLSNGVNAAPSRHHADRAA